MNRSESPNSCGAEGENARGEPNGVRCQRESGHPGPHRNGDSYDHCVEWGASEPSRALLESLERGRRRREAELAQLSGNPGGFNVAAVAGGWKFIGIEQDETYANLARLRVLAAQNDQGLFGRKA